MINNFTIGQYYPGKSFIHNLDPRTKIISVFIYITALFLARDYYSYAVVMGITMMILALSHIPIWTIARTVRSVLIFIMFIAIIHMFFTPGTEIWRWKILKITDEGLKQGIFMSLRLILMIIVSSILTFTTTPMALTDGIELLLSPLKCLGVPAHELAMMMTIAIRFIPTLLEETDKVMKAQISRGANFQSGGLIKRAKGLVPLLVPLFISAFRRAEELALAMEARGYRGGNGRTRLRVLKMTVSDGIALVFISFFLICMGYYRWFI